MENLFLAPLIIHFYFTNHFENGFLYKHQSVILYVSGKVSQKCLKICEMDFFCGVGMKKTDFSALAVPTVVGLIPGIFFCKNLYV